MPQVLVALRRARTVPILREDDPQELSEQGEAVFERLRDAFRAALDAAAGPADLRALAREMREAVVDAKVAVAEIQEAVAPTASSDSSVNGSRTPNGGAGWRGRSRIRRR